MNQTPASRVPRGRDLIVAGLLLGAAAVLSSLAPERINPEFAQRLIGMLMGAVVVLYSNAAPKALPRKLATRCGSSGQQDFRRFAGWTLVLGGLGYALIWLIAPIEIANLLSGVLLAAAVLLVLVRLAWVATRGTRA